MREVPECLNRRYKALDELIKELSTTIPVSDQPSSENCQVGIKLMCDFWNILKDDPDCNLTEEVQQRLCVPTRESSGMFGPHRINCFATGKDLENKYEDKRRDINNRIRHITCPNEAREAPRRYGCGAQPVFAGNDKIPLSKVLCNLKEAASFDKKCNVRVAELVAAQKELTEQIQVLEKREKDGVMLLKQADCMWSCMEDAYKKKLTESQERQKELLKELKEVEASSNKWRKNKKDLDFQLVNINKCHEDIIEKINQKRNDIKVIEMEIVDLTKRIESNVKDIDVARNSWKSKKEASDAKIANIAKDMAKVQKKLTAEQQFKADKEQEGAKYIKDAREDLQKICRVLLQKKLENEDLRAEKEALIQEIDLLKKTCENCKEKCTNKEKMIAEEIKRLEGEIASHTAKCIRCHECTDTVDVRKFCTDCPRCLKERDCLYEGDHCSPDNDMDCVCMSVKQKFLDNVFDNMYTVLERQIKTCPGKAVADCILNCLKRSRNGKLNQETRKVLQDFILSTVKKNLNLTIVGGAVKTRCEMDPETYKQLMLCLKEVNVTRPTKEDKGTACKKESCRRWGGTSECNCPKGPKACICLKKAPQPPRDPISCGPPEEETESDMKTCPQKEPLACGTDCGMLGLPMAEASGWRREACQGQTCPFSNNMRAAQCVLGPEALASVSVPKTHPTPPIIPDLPKEKKMATCTCGGKAIKPCPCGGDAKHVKAEVKENCDKGTCANFGKHRKGIQSKPPNSPKGQWKGQKQKPTKNNKEQLKVAIGNENGQANNQLTELTETKSGRLAMELDEHVIELIEKKSKDDPYLFVSLRRTDSGNLLIDFDTKENEFSEAQRVTVRRTPSGTRLLDMHKNMINVLKETLSSEKPNLRLSKSVELPSVKPSNHSDKDQLQPKQEELACTCPITMSSTKKEPDVIDTEGYNIFRPGPPLPIYSPPGKSVIDKYLPKSLAMSSTKNQPDIIDKEGNNISRPGPPLPIYSPPGKDVTDKYLQKRLECTCSKTTPNASICCKLNETGLPQIEELECTCPKTDLNAVSDTVLPLNDTNLTTKDIQIDIQNENVCDDECICPPEPQIEKLTCACPKTDPNSVCCNPFSEVNLVSQDKIECISPSVPQATIESKPKSTFIDTNDPQKKSHTEKLPCTCPRTELNLASLDNNFKDKNECVCLPEAHITFKPGNAISELPQKNKHEETFKPGNTISDLPQKNKHEEKLECTCPKTDPNLVCCELLSKAKVVPKDIIPDEKNNTHEKECVCPPDPPFKCIKKPEAIITKKENLECTCSKITPTSVCCKISETDVSVKNVQKDHVNVALKDFKTYCEFPKHPQTTNSWISATLKNRLTVREPDFISELKQLYKKGNANIILKVQGQSGIVRKLHTGVTRTPSGMIAIYSRHFSSLGDICFEGKEYPVFLSKTASGTYFINISQHNHTPNACLRKTPSGGILLVPKRKQIQEETQIGNEFFKVRVRGVKDYPIELPAVLKITQSENYIIVLDKEFEKRYRETVKQYIGERSEYIVDLNRTNSGYYGIDLDSDFEQTLNRRNALLVKSPSGNIKILVHGPVFEAMVDPVSINDSTSSIKAFKELVSKLPASSREFHREHLRKSKYPGKRPSSDTKLFENVKMKLQDHTRLLSEPSAVLRKTASGQYAIVLNKQSKKAFINTLQSYLTTNSQDMVPIKRSESGKIVINLNNNDEAKGHYGSLKITSSGNMYVIVDEEVIKGITQRSTKNNIVPKATRPKEVIELFENSVNEAVTTTCHAKPDDHSCDTSKFFCKEFENEAIEWSQDNPVKSYFPTIWKKGIAVTDHKSALKGKIAKESTSTEKSPHIVIKPTCDCRTPLNKFESTEQCYYLLDTVCPYHKGRYDDISNEILEISGLCNKTDNREKRTTVEFAANSNLPNISKRKRQVWDSLSYLPPQLPSFLGNVDFR